jgi:ribonucleoside-triphosphate reductase
MEREDKARIDEIHAIDHEIAELEKELAQATGSRAEVYSRIVGYYRSVKNWNTGKREEYSDRLLFKPTAAESAVDGIHAEPKEDTICAEAIQSMVLLSRDRCPNCPPVRKALEEADLDFEELSADTLEGMAFASRYDILSTPTLICLDDDETELVRFSTATQIRKFFSRQAVFA